MLSAIILSAALLAPAQCPGGTCQRPVQAAKSVVAAPAKAVQSVAVQKPVRKLFKGRLFRRWR